MLSVGALKKVFDIAGGHPLGLAGSHRGRPLRRPDACFRPPIQARLAEHWPAADHGELGQLLSRTGEGISLGDVGRRIRAAEKVSAMTRRLQIARHR
jgi:hypothetical protein